MSYTLLSSTSPKARKDHKCIWCGEAIPKGEKYTHEKSVYDGEMQDHKWHDECLKWANKNHFPHQEEFDPMENERPKS
jgi:hypothetical protein